MNLKNTLVQYHGGGYDGCFWEWNFFFLDGTGRFHDIFSSGCNGIDNIDTADALLDENKKHTYTYDLTDEKAIVEFSKECNPVNITGVLQWFCDNKTDIEFFVVCSVCGERYESCDDLSLQGWHGCGGIATTADTLICCECLTMGTCGNCDDYVGQDDLIYLGGEYAFDDNYQNKAARDLLDNGLSDVCMDCINYRVEQIKDNEQGDLLWAAMAYGTPDMFSSDMQWFWD